MTQGKRQWRWALPLAAAIVLADVITKALVQASFAYGERLAVTDFFNVVLVLNPGAAFSFLAGAGGWQKPILLGLGLLVAGALATLLVRNPMNKLTAFGFAAMLGGALGNVIDRARHGAVVDWLDFHIAGWHWPTSNLADVGITLGAATLILETMFVSPRNRAAGGAPR